MPNTIGILDSSIGGVFSGVGALVVFDNITDANYATAKVSTFANGMDLGDLYQGSVAWTGTEPETTPLLNEKGDAVYSYSENGVNSFEGTLMKLNKAVTSKFFVGTAITDASLSASTFMTSADIIGIGDQVSTITAPCGWFNREKGIAILFPKARITATLVSQDGGVGVKLSFTAEKISTANLKTMMIASAVTANYTA